MSKLYAVIKTGLSNPIAFVLADGFADLCKKIEQPAINLNPNKVNIKVIGDFLATKSSCESFKVSSEGCSYMDNYPLVPKGYYWDDGLFKKGDKISESEIPMQMVPRKKEEEEPKTIKGTFYSALNFKK